MIKYLAQLCFADAVVADISGNPITTGIGDCVSTELAILPGDVNFDGNVDVLDVVAIVNHVLGNSELGETAQVAADVNGDGNVDVLDVVAIVNVILAG